MTGVHLFAAFVAGALSRFLVERYLDYRRKVRNEAWAEVTSSQRLPLSEVFRRRGFYDAPEV